MQLIYKIQKLKKLVLKDYSKLAKTQLKPLELQIKIIKNKKQALKVKPTSKLK